jgi:hypothetical protein
VVRRHHERTNRGGIGWQLEQVGQAGPEGIGQHGASCARDETHRGADAECNPVFHGTEGSAAEAERENVLGPYSRSHEIGPGPVNLFRHRVPAQGDVFVIVMQHRDDPGGVALLASHAKYVVGSSRRLPPNIRPWDKLQDTFKKANLEPAHYSVEILEAAGLEVRKADGPPAILTDSPTPKWNGWPSWNTAAGTSSLRDGWRSGKPRDDSPKIHDCLVPWGDIPGDIKEYDRGAVKAFPEILAKAGLEVRRRA